jgi:predicted aldo/keto reductase-like oxidoreductase
MIRNKPYNINTLNRREFLKKATNKSIGAAIGLSALTTLKCNHSSSGMQQRILGRTGLQVSILGFGCTQVKNRMAYRRAVDLGINYFHMGDRDPAYNLEACEVLLPYRKDIYIAYMSHPKDSGALLLEDLNGFLKQSKMSYLDVWFVITPRPEVLNEFIEAARIARSEGKIRWTGITTHSLDRDIATLTMPESPIDVVMMTFNYLSPPDHSEKLGNLHAAGLGITPMKPLAGRFYEQTADNPGALLRWLIADSRIHTVPVIMKTAEEVEQNAAAIQQSFSEEDRKTLQAMTAYNSGRFCRMCGSCEGKCPQGLAVSDLVRTAMYAEGYRDLNLARANVALIPEKNRRITCWNCKHCTVICPNGVAVKQQILKADTYLVG